MLKMLTTYSHQNNSLAFSGETLVVFLLKYSCQDSVLTNIEQYLIVEANTEYQNNNDEMGN